MKKSIEVSSSTAQEVLNITAEVTSVVAGIGEAHVLVSVPHTTAAVFIAEDDAELRADFVKVARESLAWLRPFQHVRNDNPNTEAHVFSSLFGTSISLRVENGELDLGRYQNIMFMELDGPKKRSITVSLVT